LAEDEHEAEEAATGKSTEQQEVKKRRSIFDRFTEGIREFLDNAE
jgi:hypothetical protein